MRRLWQRLARTLHTAVIAHYKRIRHCTRQYNRSTNRWYKSMTYLPTWNIPKMGMKQTFSLFVSSAIEPEQHTRGQRYAAHFLSSRNTLEDSRNDYRLPLRRSVCSCTRRTPLTLYSPTLRFRVLPFIEASRPQAYRHKLCYATLDLRNLYPFNDYVQSGTNSKCWNLLRATLMACSSR